MKVYVAGALTYHANTDQKKVYKKIGELCKGKGIEAHVPHLAGTDPITNPDVTPEYIWRVNEDYVRNADLVIAYVGKPSLGTGAELEIARIGKTDIILWWYKNEKVSRMARGNPAVIAKFEVENTEEIINKLDKILKENYGK